MSRKYKFRNPEGIYFVSFATVNWIDVFTRAEYKDIIVESLNYCIDNKGLRVYAWVIMSNHLHLVVATQQEPLENIIRDLKKYTSRTILKAIETYPQESRKAWMLWMFQRAGQRNSNNQHYQFWQQHNQQQELSTMPYDMESTMNYIHENPVKAGFINRA